jgi:hypothetical protein
MRRERPIEFPFHVTDADRQADVRIAERDRNTPLLLPGRTGRRSAGRLKITRRSSRRCASGSASAASSRARPMKRSWRHRSAAINLAGKTTLRQLAALIERADLVVANDSGPMHIAAG